MPYDLQYALAPKTERAAIQLRAAYKLVVAGRFWRARLGDRLKANGQTDPKFAAMYHLAAAPAGLIQAELAERMAVSGASLVRQLDALEADGLIVRTPIVGDRRARLVRLSRQGIEGIRGLDTIASTLRDEVFAGVSAEDLAAFDRVLDQILERLSLEATRMTSAEKDGAG